MYIADICLEWLCEYRATQLILSFCLSLYKVIGFESHHERYVICSPFATWLLQSDCPCFCCLGKCITDDFVQFFEHAAETQTLLCAIMISQLQQCYAIPALLCCRER